MIHDGRCLPLFLLPLVMLTASEVGVLLVSGQPSGRVPGDQSSKAPPVGRIPRCGEGYGYFAAFMKCDGSLNYCFHYHKKSCVGPPNWGCVHALNRQSGTVTGKKKDGFVKRLGLGNSRCCWGRYQSPVDIPMKGVRCVPQLSTPAYSNRSRQLMGVWQNTGAYPEFRIDPFDYDNPLLLKNVPFKCVVPGSALYVLSSIQVHVGKAGGQGFEHRLQGRSFDGELHLMHVRRDFWKPSSPKKGRPSRLHLRCASQTPLGLTVVAIFLSMSEGQTNEELDMFLSVKRRGGSKSRKTRLSCFCRRRSYIELCLWYAARGEELECRKTHYYRLPRVNTEGGKDKDHHTLPADQRWGSKFKLKPGLLMPMSSNYFQYFGSLTSPPCSEVVNWIVMKEPLKITMEQLAALRQLQSKDADRPQGEFGNVRPPLPLNGRLVTTNGPFC